MEWVAVSHSRGSSQPRDKTYVSCISCIGRWILHHWATRKTQHVFPSSLKLLLLSWQRIEAQRGHWKEFFKSTCSPSVQFSSVQFSRSVVSGSLRPHEPQHTRHPCPSPTPGVYPNSCPLSQWFHPSISSSIVPFSSCPQSFSQY